MGLIIAGTALMPVPVMASQSYYYEPEEIVETLEEVIEIYNPYDSCITTARLLGVPLPKGNADQLIPNGSPTKGGVILFSYEENDHVAVILQLFERGMWVGEGNFKAGEYGERFVYYDDPFIRGFAAY